MNGLRPAVGFYQAVGCIGLNRGEGWKYERVVKSEHFLVSSGNRRAETEDKLGPIERVPIFKVIFINKHNFGLYIFFHSSFFFSFKVEISSYTLTNIKPLLQF